MPITLRSMRQCDWTLAFEYDEPPGRIRVYTNQIAPKLTLAHVAKPGGRVDIQYRSHGTKYPSLVDAVRAYNNEEDRQSGRYQAAGSVATLKDRKGSLR